MIQSYQDYVDHRAVEHLSSMNKKSEWFPADNDIKGHLASAGDPWRKMMKANDFAGQMMGKLADEYLRRNHAKAG